MDATASAGGLELLPSAVSLPGTIGVYRVRGLASLGLLVLPVLCLVVCQVFALIMRATMQANSVCIRSNCFCIFLTGVVRNGWTCRVPRQNVRVQPGGPEVMFALGLWVGSVTN